MTTELHPFQTSTHTIDEYKELQIQREFTAQEHVQWLMETVAQTTKGYIFKRRRGSGYWLEEITADAVIKRMLNFDITLAHKTTTTVGVTSTTKTTLKHYKAYAFVASAEHPKLMAYDALEMFTSDPHRLSRYVPPIGPANDDWAERWINYLRSRVVNQRAFDEEISSHAYRLRYPSTFIEKCFVHHSVEGNTGKSTLAWTLSLLYPKLANINVRHDQLTEKINGWTTDYMMLHIEELEGTEYENKGFATWVKNATMRSASVRKMYSDTTDGTNNAIIGVNTNQPDLYGLATTNDTALKARLVVLLFKEEHMTGEQWAAKFTEFDLNNNRPDYQQQEEKFAAALYHYLRYTYKIVDGFTPNRYNQPDKQEVLDQLRRKAGRLPDRFMASLEKINNSDYPSPACVFELLKDKRSKSDEPKKVIVSLKNLRNAWTSFMRDKPKSQANYSMEKSVEPTLTRIGFTLKRTSAGMVYVCDDVSGFEEWYQSRGQAEEADFDMSDYEAVPAQAAAAN